MENIFFDTSKIKHLGKNVIIGKTVRIRKPQEAIIKNNSIIDDFTYISTVFEMGCNSHIASNVSISGGQAGRKFTIGNYSTISNGTSVHCASSGFKECTLELPSIPKEEQIGGDIADITIGDYVTVGAHCCILPGVNVPEGVAFGAYTLIKPGIKLLPYHLYAGTNCKLIGKRKNIDLIKRHKNGRI